MALQGTGCALQAQGYVRQRCLQACWLAVGVLLLRSLLSLCPPRPLPLPQVKADVYEKIDKELLGYVEDVLLNRCDNATERILEYAATLDPKCKPTDVKKKGQASGAADSGVKEVRCLVPAGRHRSPHILPPSRPAAAALPPANHLAGAGTHAAPLLRRPRGATCLWRSGWSMR